jgi:GAF domain-containing protein
MISPLSTFDWDAVRQLLMDPPGDRDSLQSLLSKLAETARTIFQADIAAVYGINPVTASYPQHRKFVQPPAVSGQLLGAPEHYLDAPRPFGLTEEVIDHGELYVENTAVTPEQGSTFTRAEGVQSFAAIALRAEANDRTLGILYVNFRHPHVFSPVERDALKRYGEFAARVLKPTWYLRRYLGVIRIGQEINQELSDVPNLFKKLSQHLPGIIDTSHGFSLAVYKPETGLLDIYIWEAGQAFIRIDDSLEGISKWVLENCKSLLVNEFSREVEKLQEQGIKAVHIATTSNNRPDDSKESLVFVPVYLRRNAPLGVLSVQHHRTTLYDNEDQKLMEALSHYLALALSNIKLYSDLEKINKTGQLLTRRLDNADVMDDVVREIRYATRADIVVLYSYDSSLGEWQLPPVEDGKYLAPTFQQPKVVRPDDMASLTLCVDTPKYAENSGDLYTMIGGDPSKRTGNFEQREKMASTAALPLRVADEAVGVLFVNYRYRQSFSLSQRQLIESLAAFAAITIRNARDYHALQDRRLRELILLQNIDKRIGTILDLSFLLHEILKIASESVTADEASILLYEPDVHVLYTAAAIGRHVDQSLAQAIPLSSNTGLARHAFEIQQPVRIDNVKTDVRGKDQHLAVADDILSELDVPIIDGAEVVGVLNFESVREAAYKDDDETFLVTLAGQAALAIRNANAYEREKRTAEERQALIEISREVVAQLDLQQVFNLILDKALEVTNCESGNLMLYDLRRNDLWMAAQRGVRESNIGGRQSLDTGIVGWVARNKHHLNVDVTEPPWNSQYVSYIDDTCSELSVPLLEKEQLRGVLNIESVAHGGFPETDVRLLTALAEMAVIALQNAERYAAATEGRQRLRVLNTVDKKIIGQAGDPDSVMEAILENSLFLTVAQAGELTLFRAKKAYASYSALKKEDGEITFLGKRSGPDVPAQPKGIVRRVLETRKSYRTQIDLADSRDYADSLDNNSKLAVPLKTEEGQVVGVIELGTKVAFAFDDDDAEVIELLAGQAVIAYNLAQRYAEVAAERTRFKALFTAGEQLARISDLSQVELVFSTVGEVLAALTPAEVTIRRYDDATQELVLVYMAQRRHRAPLTRVNLQYGVNGQVAREKRTIVIDNIESPPPGVRPQFADSETTSAILVPILFNNRYYGNVIVTEARPYAFDTSDVNLIEGLAQQIALHLYRLEIAAERSKAQQRLSAAEAMNSMGQSAFDLAHRLGNDLGLVNTYLENIRSELNAHGVELSEVDANIKKVARDIRRVLMFAANLRATFRNTKLGEKQLVRSLIPARVLLEEAARSCPTCPQNILISVPHVADEVVVNVDNELIADALRNLVINAIEAMPNGGSIELSAYRQENHVEFCVHDTGVGIPRDQQTQIFDLFFTTKPDGSGFGLWSSRRNALLHSGDLLVDSEPGKGTTFRLVVPYE